MRLRTLLTTATLAATASLALAQPPGGGDRGGRGGPPGGFGGGSPGGFSRGGFTADSGFDRMLQSYNGTGDVVDYSRLTPEYRQRTDGMLRMMNQPLLPTSGTVTREQYRAQFNQRMEAMRAARGGGGPPGSMTMTMTAPGGAAPGAPGTPTTPSPSGGQPQWNGQPGMGGPPGGFGGGDRSRGGFDPSTMPDDQLRDMMRRYDRDQDGRISAAEAAQSDRLRDSFTTYDVNRDGFIDLSEYRGYMIARMSNSGRGDPNQPGGGQPGWNGQPNWGGGQQGWGGGTPPGTDPSRPLPPAEDPRPVVYRYGKLPKEFPYSDLDGDKDGQVGMYEWKAAKKTLAEFKELDLNRDGFLTAEEFLRARPPAPATDKDKGGSMADERNRGEKGRDERRRDERGGRDERGSKDDKRQPGENPFSRSRG